jgi:hypothetical protein
MESFEALKKGSNSLILERDGRFNQLPLKPVTL